MKKTQRVKKSKPFVSIFLGIAVGLLLKLFILDAVFISGSSMEPRLHGGQFVLLNKTAYGLVIPFSSKVALHWAYPEVNDIVYYLHDSKIVIKRCVGIENEGLSFYSNTGYYVVIDNNRERTIPLSEQEYQRLKNTRSIPQGYIFAVGDNYEESVDSRDYGFVFASHVAGKVLCK